MLKGDAGLEGAADVVMVIVAYLCGFGSCVVLFAVLERFGRSERRREHAEKVARNRRTYG